MEIDHIFIFSDCKGEEANQLMDVDLTEGSSRRHKKGKVQSIGNSILKTSFWKSYG